MRTIIFYSILFIAFLPESHSQLCIDYPEIDGGVCGGCAPSGWTAVTGAEEIEDPSIWAGSCNFPGTSPSGTNVVGLHINSGIAEAISTTVDVTAGVEYNFLVWWFGFDCSPTPICCSDFIVEIDGQTFTFPPEGEWSLIDLCITATSSTMDILLSGTLTPSSSGFIFIDGAVCPDEPGCCGLQIELEENASICPNNDYLIETEILFSSGGHSIEWTCDPIEGLNYLDDTDIEEPTFNFPNTDPEFDGEKFNFKLTVTEGSCVAEKEICIEVGAPEISTFDFEDEIFCQTDDLIILPTVSNEGIVGTWNISEVLPNNFPGQTLTLTFTPDPNLAYCASPSEHEMEIEEFEQLDFFLPEELCRSEYDVYDLDPVSIQGYFGQWYYESFLIFEINLQDFDDGPIDLLFIADGDLCVDQFETQIEISTGDLLSFNTPLQICSKDSTYVFPEESIEGVDGDWETPTLNPSATIGVYINTFTPNDQDCYQAFTTQVEIIEEITPTFDTLSMICKSAGIINLNNISNEGFLGTWDVSSFNPDTITADTFLVNWVPQSVQGPCVGPQSMEITFQDIEVPQFNLPTQLCSLDPIFNLPSTSLNGLDGSWSIIAIDPNVMASTSISSTFTPSDSCASAIELRFDILLAEESEFSFENTICENEMTFILPNISDNNIEGNWSTNNIDVSQIPDSGLEVTFTPNANQFCVNNFSIFVFTEAAITPTFDLPEFLCFDSDVFNLPLFSLESIEGTWNQDFIDASAEANNTLTISFMPNSMDCYNAVSYDISIGQETQIQINSIDPSSCQTNNGEIEISNNQIDEEFSIDGIDWSTQTLFDNLSSGQFTIAVRNILIPECITTFEVNLSSTEAPEIISIDATDDLSCTIDEGAININAQGNDLVYSIDNGVTWQTDPLFENLSVGEFQIIVRNSNNIDCFATATQTLISVEETVIISITESQPSDCMLEDGSIAIDASGTDLEYSIDNGMSWSNNPFFQNLSSGSYDIIVQSQLAQDCAANEFVLLSLPQQPSIDNIEGIDPNTCELSSGSINIIATGNSLEYSIDGIDWQPESLFENLEFGAYTCYVRPTDNPNCFTINDIILELESADLDEPLIDITAPSDCDSNDGMITILNHDLSYEYSLDSGLTWSDDMSFSNLSADNYSLQVRLINAPDCRSSIDFSLTAPDCPCNDLTVEFSITNIFCVGDMGEIEITNVSGMVDPNFDLLWNNNSMDFLLSDLNSGDYQVTISYDEDCTWVEDITIIANDPLGFNLTTYPADCASATNGIIEVDNTTGGNGVYSYSLDGTNFQNDNSFFNLSPDNYTVYVSDSNTCIEIDQTEINADQVLNLQLPPVMTINLGDAFVLNPLINEASIDSFLWTSNSEDINQQSLILSVTPTQTTTYTLTVYFGECMDTRSITINVISNETIYIANAFSKSDFNNNVFYLQGNADSNISILRFSIFDRWGNLVFDIDNPRLNDPDDGWDGTYNNGNAEIGIYVYTVQIEIAGQIENRSGSLTLFR